MIVFWSCSESEVWCVGCIVACVVMSAHPSIISVCSQGFAVGVWLELMGTELIWVPSTASHVSPISFFKKQQQQDLSGLWFINSPLLNPEQG